MPYLDDNGEPLPGDGRTFRENRKGIPTDDKIENILSNVRFGEGENGRASSPAEINAYRNSLYYGKAGPGLKTGATGPGTDAGGGGDAASFDNFLDFWDAWDGLDIGAAAAAWTTAHPNDPATAIGHSGDAVRYRGQDWDGITNVGSENQAKVRLFNPSAGGGGGGGTNPTGANNYGLNQFSSTFQDPSAPIQPFQAGTFTPPTGVDDSNDPGFSTRLKAAQQALERSASARGTLLSGGTLKAITRFSEDYASNEYDKIFGRDLATFNTNEGERFKAFASNASLTGDQYGRALSTFNTNTGLYNDAYSRARANQNDLFGQQYSLASLGLAGTNSAANSNNLLTSNYIDSLLKGVGGGNDYLAAGANANAAGQVGGSNAYNAALASLGRNYLDLYLNSRGSGAGTGATA